MEKKTNVIFFFSDQQRYDTVCEEVTPNICELAQDGTSFDFAYTCQPVCGPARACLQTGVYASINGCITNGIPMDLSCTERSLAECFNGAGYDTAYIGKWHLASHYLQYRNKGVPQELRGGYRYWLAADLLEFSSDGYHGTLWDNDCNPVEFEGIRADKLTDYAIDYIRSVKEKPFFLFLSQLEPHHQNTSGNYECPEDAGKEFENFPYPEDLAELKGDYPKHYADYLACCKRLDYNVGRLVEELKNLGIYDDTVLVYTSDHGCHFRTRNGEYKRSCHDASTHIPLIVVGKDIPKNKRYSHLASLIDLPPTLLEIAGIEIPKCYNGKPLIEAVKEDRAVRDNVFIQISESHTGRCVTTKRYVYSIKKCGGKNVYKDDYLYDRELDPAQRHNLINSAKHQEIKKQLRKTLIEEMVKAGEEAPIIKRRIFYQDI